MGTPLASQTVSGYNSSPPPDDGTVSAANKVTWAKIKTQLGDPLNSFDTAINSALRTALNVTPTSQSTAYTTTTADHLRPIEVTGTTTISLGDAATMAAAAMGYAVPIVNTGTATVTVAVITATDKIAGRTNGTVTLAPGQGMIFTVNSTSNGYDITAATGFSPFVLTGAAGTNTATANAPANMTALYSGLIVVFTPANTNTGATTLNITPSGGTALTAKNVFYAGAACVGDELKASVPVLLEYDGTQFNLLGPVLHRPTLATPQASTSGTAITFTGIPAWATKISINFAGVSISGTANILIQLGDSGGIETTGYNGAGWQLTNGSAVSVATQTNGFLISSGAAAANFSGTITLTLENASTFNWCASGTLGRTDANSCSGLGGNKSTSAALDRVSITTTNGTDTFDAGEINVLYE